MLVQQLNISMQPYNFGEWTTNPEHMIDWLEEDQGQRFYSWKIKEAYYCKPYDGSRTIQPDCYITMNTFKKPTKRLKSNIKQRHWCYVDFDFPDMFSCLESGILDKLQYDLPVQPTMIVFSGVGAWALWRIEPDHTEEEWRDLQRKLTKELGGDMSVATDMSRSIRIAGSTNTKSGQKVSAMRLNTNRYTIKDMYTCFNFRVHSLSSKEEYLKPVRVKRNTNNTRLSMNKARLEDLRKLIKLRDGDLMGHRNALIFVYGRQITMTEEISIDNMIGRLGRLNKKFKDPLRASDIRAVAKSVITTKKDNRGHTNKYIIEALAITPEEQKHMEILIGSKEKARRNVEIQRKIRGGGSMEEYRKSQEIRKKDILSQISDLLEKKYPTSEILKIVGIGKTQFFKYKKQILS